MLYRQNKFAPDFRVKNDTRKKAGGFFKTISHAGQRYYIFLAGCLFSSAVVI